MASITLRPISGSGSNWSNIGNAYDGNESTNASVSASLFNSPRTLTLDFNTTVIPSGAIINSATLTLRSKAGKTTMTARVDINGNSEYRVINQKQSTEATNYTADVTSYMSELSTIAVMVYNSNFSGNTFDLHELWIDVDYTIPPTYTVRFLDWNNIVIDTQTIISGGSATSPPDPVRDGYRFTGWSGSYTNITADTDITAQYIKTYNIVASTNIGGSISPSDTTTLDEGQSQTYTISANAGYRIKSVTIDGTGQGVITSYTFSNVTADHTIAVEFEAIPTYTITASSSMGGSISPDGETVVLENGSQSYSISANRGYGIKDVLVDGVSQGAITSYTFTNVNSNHTIEVVFEPVPTVVAAIENNVFYAIDLFEGYDNFSIGPDGVYLNAIHEDLNENESIYLDSNCILHVFKFIGEDL